MHFSIPLPRHLIALRHGESEGNVANRQSRSGDDSAFTPEFRAKPSYEWEITSTGEREAETAGAWLKAMGFRHFNLQYVSSFTRTQQTAMCTELPGPWIIEPNLRERSVGVLDKAMPHSERLALYGHEFLRAREHGIHWRPEGGESQADVRVRRVRPLLQSVYERANGENVMMVSHLETILAIMAEIEDLSDEEYAAMSDKNSPLFRRVGNCRIIHYSRVNPVTGEVSERFTWRRSICPMTEPDPNAWREINRL